MKCPKCQLLTVILAALICVPIRASADESIKLKGIVHDSESNSALSGAVVSIDGNLARYDAVSDGRGFFLLPLLEQVAAGQLLHLYVAKQGYHPHDENVVASTDAILQIRLTPYRSPTPTPTIEDVVILATNDAETIEIELLVANRGADPVWFKKLAFSGEVALRANGYTGFIRRVDYQIKLHSLIGQQIEGTAKPSGTDLLPYPVNGYYRYIVDTQQRGEKAWEIGFSTKFPVRIDANDKLAVRLSLRKPSLHLIETESVGEMIAMYIGGITRQKFVFSLITDNDVVVSWEGTDDRLLAWFSDHLGATNNQR